MNNIRHQETSRDSLYPDFEASLQTAFKLWNEGEGSLRFTIPILCAVKLEAFINVAGKLKVDHWDILERKLSFSDKCKIIFSQAGLVFDPNIEPNKSAVHLFEIRNALVHPKMSIQHIDEMIDMQEYQRRDSSFRGIYHPQRSRLTSQKIRELKAATDQFVSTWADKLLDNIPGYWLTGGATGGFAFEPISQHDSD